jgi:hypothetical protein
VQVSKASTTSALINARAPSAAYISTQRARSMPVHAYLQNMKTNALDRFQQLELKHVEDRGCFPAMEFR